MLSRTLKCGWFTVCPFSRVWESIVLLEAIPFSIVCRSIALPNKNKGLLHMRTLVKFPLNSIHSGYTTTG